MKAIALMYHDVVEAGTEASSGFASGDADLYKIDPQQFSAHLKVLGEGTTDRPVFITFDDGGRSAYTHVAPQLEREDRRGHFFVATDYIDTPTFVTSDQIRDLDARGHVVGSHSASHPLRMAAASDEAILAEWRLSLEKLADIIGKRPSVASVPGGLYSRHVAQMASLAGIRTLFTSEPTTRTWQVADTTCVGRYTINRHTSLQTVSAVARGAAAPWMRQYLYWNVKKVMKSITGEKYLAFRHWWLNKH
jgi:peptidoglycan/xylan/chitin deacetylase (PgdA/CDA1 family)